jgi:hypothetical protein
MPSKLIIASFAAGIVVGAAVMGAIGLRNSGAQTEEQAGPWQLAAQQWGAAPIAFRLNTNSGGLEECMVSSGQPTCWTMPPPKSN